MVSDKQSAGVVAKIGGRRDAGCGDFRCDMDEKTAVSTDDCSDGPASRLPHAWRTRPDPFAEVWPQVEASRVRHSIQG